jgi:SRSO17 transposase
MKAHEAKTAAPLLKHPQAQELLADATLAPAAVRGCQGRLEQFLARYLPWFYRREQRAHAVLVVQGLLSGLERKTCEPIAREHGVPRKPVQFFVGQGKWDDEAVMAELRRHVREELGDPQAILALDPSSFPKKGTASCGVARQWCGRLGKVENCQTGVFLGYAAAGGHAPLDGQLYLPREWTADRKRRGQGHVPPGLRFAEKWRIGLALLDRCRQDLPHAWVTGDDDLGRVSLLRRKLRQRGERYVLDIPCNTTVRDLEARPRPRAAGRFCRADHWAQRQPAGRWQRFPGRAGEQGPLTVEALTTRVQAKDEHRRVGPAERLLVVRTVEGPARTWYSLSNAGPEVPLAELVRAHGEHHRIEQLFQEAKGQAGLGQYEVRSWGAGTTT